MQVKLCVFVMIHGVFYGSVHAMLVPRSYIVVRVGWVSARMGSEISEGVSSCRHALLVADIICWTLNYFCFV